MFNCHWISDPSKMNKDDIVYTKVFKNVKWYNNMAIINKRFNKFQTQVEDK